jgi:ABC-type iron transport system FetAB ATPase subunit
MQPSATQTGAVVLRLNDLAVAADGRDLLTGVDLELHAGERVAVRGPSGCGKTSLLRAVTGLSDPSAGSVELVGRCPDDLRWPCYRRRTVLVEQQPVLLSGTVRENLARPFSYKTATTVFDPNRAAASLAGFGLDDAYLEKEARSLSVGEQQRVCLCRALLLEPQVLLLDEPTSALDETNVARVEQVISEEVERRGLAALIVTHNREQAERWCHRSFDLAPHMPGGAGS